MLGTVTLGWGSEFLRKPSAADVREWDKHAVVFRLLKILLPLSVRASEQQVLPLGQHLIDIVQRERRDRRAFLLGCSGSECFNRGVDIGAESVEIRDGTRLSDCRQDRDQ